MRRLLAFAFACFPLSVAIACGSSDEETGGGSGAYEPAGNGVPMNESQACESLKDAKGDRWLQLGCGPLTGLGCPTLIQAQKQTPACSQYDQGALQACVAYLSGLASCDELKTKTCIVKPIPNSAPSGCPAVVDSGSDAGQDAGEDAEIDAGEDAEIDAGEDAEIDAPEDVVVEDVATDALSE